MVSYDGLSRVATLGIEIDASGHRGRFVTHLIRENRENEGERRTRGTKTREEGEREESIRERPSEIMYTSKMMATVHAMDSRRKAEGGVSLSGAADSARDRGYTGRSI